MLPKLIVPSIIKDYKCSSQQRDLESVHSRPTDTSLDSLGAPKKTIHPHQGYTIHLRPKYTSRDDLGRSEDLKTAQSRHGDACLANLAWEACHLGPSRTCPDDLAFDPKASQPRPSEACLAGLGSNEYPKNAQPCPAEACRSDPESFDDQKTSQLLQSDCLAELVSFSFYSLAPLFLQLKMKY